MRLLIAEDDLDLAEALTAFLCKNRFAVDAVHNGDDAYDHALLGGYDAVILDIMMPGIDGIQVLRRLRAEGIYTPIMLLTAKNEKSDRIMGFDSGADDYLSKPFSMDELLSRVRAMLRRPESSKPVVLRLGEISMNCGTGVLRFGASDERLSGREYQIMELFMRTPRIIIPAEQILERVWGGNTDTDIGVVAVHISNLRKKLRAIGAPAAIQAKRGIGYALVEDGYVL